MGRPRFEVPDIHFQAGWYKKSFSSLGQQVKNGGKVVYLADKLYKNNFKNSFSLKLN